MELWVSLGSFDGRCSLRTWVYRIAHNVGASHQALRLIGIQPFRLLRRYSKRTDHVLIKPDTS